MPGLQQFACRLVSKFSQTWGRVGLLGLFLLSGWTTTLAQEAPASQMYAQRLFINPAFTGLLSDYSITAGHRSQWTGTENGYSTQWLSAEYKLKESKTALGATIVSDKSIEGGYKRIQVGGIYAYHTKLKPKLDFSAGLQVAYASQNPGFSDLIFEDQLGADGAVQQPSAEVNRYTRSSYLTFATGALLFTDQFWFGLSAQHINNPKLGDASNNSLPPHFQVQTGYKFYAKGYFAKDHFEEISFIPTLSYTQQRTFKRIDAFLYTIMTPVTLGIGYSRLPGSSTTSSASSFTGLAGITYKNFKFGYSYRHPVADQHIALGAVHEVSFSFQMVDYRKIYLKLGSSKNYNRIACPEF